MLATTLALAAFASSVTIATLPREFRGVWVATVANIDWPSKKTLAVDQQKKELLAIVERTKELNMNAIVFQVRPSADALYPSNLEPWSEWLTGKTGQAPSPVWDPLEFIIEESHRRGIELHAWFNPYRARHKQATTSPNATHIAKTHPQSVVEYGGYLWMDPSDPFVQGRTVDVMMDVVKRYDVDGIHIDDYFYPYPVTDKDKKKIPFPDAKNYATYQRNGGKLGVADWRRKQVDDVIERIYNSTKSTKKWVKFGISPFGIYRPGHPPSISAGIDQYDELYADCLKWLEKGWCDYMTPQLYWPIAQTKQSFPVLLDWWMANNRANRHIWPGQYSSRVSETWEPKEVLDQIDITRKVKANGTIHFSMKVFMEDSKRINDTLVKGPYSEYVLPPESPWLVESGPVPTVESPRIKKSADTWRITFDPVVAGSARFIAVVKGQRVLGITAGKESQVSIPVSQLDEADVESIRVHVVDRAGRLGDGVRPGKI